MKEVDAGKEPLDERADNGSDPADLQEHAPEHEGAFGLYERDGLTLLLDRSSLVDQVVIGGGGWEVPQTIFMREAARQFLVPDNGAFLDVGAYWGHYSMHAVAAGVGEVHSFEPDPRNHAQLQAQLFLNDMLHATEVHRCAVADRSGDVTFLESVKGENRGVAGIVDEGTEGTIEIPGVALDDLFDWSGRAVVVKLDIEGQEAAALRGMERLVTRNRVFMQVEAFDETRADTLAAAEAMGLRHIFTVQPIDHYVTNLGPEEIGWFYVMAARMGLIAR